MPTVWQMQEAKSKLGRVIRDAEADGPQIITRNGKTVAYVVSAEEYENGHKKSTSKNLLQALADSPLKGSGINVERRHGPQKPPVKL